MSARCSLPFLLIAADQIRPLKAVFQIVNCEVYYTAMSIRFFRGLLLDIVAGQSRKDSLKIHRGALPPSQRLAGLLLKTPACWKGHSRLQIPSSFCEPGPTGATNLHRNSYHCFPDPFDQVSSSESTHKLCSAKKCKKCKKCKNAKLDYIHYQLSTHLLLSPTIFILHAIKLCCTK
jgi:hypothetical protein